MVTPIIIVTRDRLSYLQRTITSLSHLTDVEVHIFDHGTTEPAAREWLMHVQPHRVVRRGDAYVHSLWDEPEFERLVGDRHFVVTDPDLDLSECPSDVVQRSVATLTHRPHLVKVGPGLRVDDLPNTTLARRVREWESQFWRNEIAFGLYEAPIDTTFAVYRPLTERRDFALGPAGRWGYVSLARHLPWYEVAPLSDELRYYRDHALPGASHWLPSASEVMTQ